MTKEFKAVSNSTIYDVCLNTYGTLNLLAKLMDDNSFQGVTIYPTSGQIFLYDDEFVNVQTNQNLERNFTVSAGEVQVKYATK